MRSGQAAYAALELSLTSYRLDLMCLRENVVCVRGTVEFPPIDAAAVAAADGASSSTTVGNRAESDMVKVQRFLEER